MFENLFAAIFLANMNAFYPFKILFRKFLERYMKLNLGSCTPDVFPDMRNRGALEFTAQQKSERFQL